MFSIVQISLVLTQASNVQASRHATSSAAMLPSFSTVEHDASGHVELETSNVGKAENESNWWFRAGDRIYYAPRNVALLQSAQLSTRIEDYYYAYGSSSAVPTKLLHRRVGGDGRLHIFYMPEGPQLLQTGKASIGTRRTSLSKVRSLTHGMRLHTTFPVYPTSPSYVNPLSERGQEIERTAAANITGDGVWSQLASLLSLPSLPSQTRSFKNADASTKAQAFILQTLSSFGLTTCLHKFVAAGVQMANVVAFLPGKTSDTVTVGAHYDSRPFDGAAPGAEDNGSGVAVLLAVAKAFMDAATSPLKSIYFVAFAGEEVGLYGSQAFVDYVLKSDRSNLDAKCMPSTSFLQSTRTKDREHLALIMDEVGWKSPSLPQLTVNLESYDTNTTSATLESLAQASLTHNGESLQVVHSNNPFGSDHMSFLDKGIGAVLAINGDDEAYPAYHSSDDVIENVDKSLMAMIAKMNLGALMRLAGLQA
eukprot:TRINITY_DN5783_c0_g1_i1.p1 TRINITY_DN5783_c0_g1~~TRINITY_DN5783_c0_g1_i1.p1  ORF type:complete len:479 (-),score=80.90 TRINITY_DN5783_c0_g1_i1:129-1565(-)